MSIAPTIADRPLKCRGCMAGGNEEPTIQPGDDCFEMTHLNRCEFCCSDCFRKLQKEIESDNCAN